MDKFYRNENIEVFRKWVYYQIMTDPRLTLEKYDERTYKIYYKNKEARFVVWPMGIIEESIIEGDQLLFYLHFQFYSFPYAKDLFERFISKLTEDKVEEKTKVLLCCTGGMTTGYFAEKMNEYCEMHHLPYNTQATAAYHLNDVYQGYDMILVAPQLRYQVMSLSQQFHPIKVVAIDPMTFATYDCQSLIHLIKENCHE